MGCFEACTCRHHVCRKIDGDVYTPPAAAAEAVPARAGRGQRAALNVGPHCFGGLALLADVIQIARTLRRRAKRIGWSPGILQPRDFAATNPSAGSEVRLTLAGNQNDGCPCGHKWL